MVESLSNLIPALIKFQSECPDPKKDKVNPMFKSKYASIDSIVHTVKPYLAKHDLAFTQTVTAEEAVIVVTTTLYHKSGESIWSVTKLKADKTTPQGFGSAFTYGKRYGLSSLLGVSADEDDDGNAAEQEPKRIAWEKPKISSADMEKLIKLVDERGWSASQVNEFIQKAFKVKNSTELSKRDFDILFKTISVQTFEEASEDL